MLTRVLSKHSTPSPKIDPSPNLVGRVGDQLRDGERDVDANDDRRVNRRDRLRQRRKILLVDLPAVEDVPQVFEAVEDG